MKKLTMIVGLLTFLAFTSCHKDAQDPAEMSVYLHDAPGTGYEKIKIHLKGVSIYSQSSGQWLTLTVDNGVFDLLTLDSLHQAFLGKLKVTGDDVSQVKLEIANDNSVTVSGIDYPLVLDASDLDKLSIKMDNKINKGSFYKLTIDFKAAESVDSSGNVFKLKASLKISIKSV